jgi:hypothetical protein
MLYHKRRFDASVRIDQINPRFNVAKIDPVRPTSLMHLGFEKPSHIDGFAPRIPALVIFAPNRVRRQARPLRILRHTVLNLRLESMHEQIKTILVVFAINPIAGIDNTIHSGRREPIVQIVQDIKPRIFGAEMLVSDHAKDEGIIRPAHILKGPLVIGRRHLPLERPFAAELMQIRPSLLQPNQDIEDLAWRLMRQGAEVVQALRGRFQRGFDDIV